MTLSIENSTERNYAAVQVVLELSEGARAFFSPEGALEFLDAPEAPAPWGMPIGPITTARQRVFDEARRYIRLVDGRVEVVFSPVDVWPRRSRQLPTLFLALPRSLVGDVVRVTWTAASMSADSNVAGTFELPVEPEPVPATALLSAGWEATQ